MTAAREKVSGKDGVIALGCWVLTVVSATVLILTEPSPELHALTVAGTEWWVLVSTLTVQAVVLLRSRTHPRAVLLAVSAIPLVSVTISPNALFGFTVLPIMVAVFLAVARTSLGSSRRALLFAALTTGAADWVIRVAVSNVGVGTTVAQSITQSAVVIGLPVLIGSVVASRREARTAYSNELAALRRERDALVQAAVAGERTAMARELHDIAAHHLSAIALMAAATRRQIGVDSDAARHSADLIRDQARAVLDDLRRLVGLLRDDSSATERAIETIEGTVDLVRARRATGAVIDLEIEGAADAGSLDARIGPLAQLVAYRMVQESLANAARHAPGARCTVELDGVDDTALRVTVTNAKALSHKVTDGPSTGFGLVGMVERAALVGGDVTYGPTDDGGWSVTLVLPREKPIPISEERT